MFKFLLKIMPWQYMHFADDFKKNVETSRAYL